MTKVDLVALFRYSRGGYREVGASLLSEVRSERTRGSRQVTKEEMPIRHKESNFHYEGGKKLEQVARKCCGISIRVATTFALNQRSVQSHFYGRGKFGLIFFCYYSSLSTVFSFTEQRSYSSVPYDT